MSTLSVVYDATQHCTAMQKKKGKAVAIDCPYTGKGEELSSGELVGAGVASCMLMSMGSLAMNNKIDISKAEIEVDFKLTANFSRIDTIKLTVNMPKNYSKIERLKLERAAEACPIKHSFHPEVTIAVNYHYPE
jgi:uncharacterized OsmC-like protein